MQRGFLQSIRLEMTVHRVLGQAYTEDISGRYLT